MQSPHRTPVTCSLFSIRDGVLHRQPPHTRHLGRPPGARPRRLFPEDEHPGTSPEGEHPAPPGPRAQGPFFDAVDAVHDEVVKRMRVLVEDTRAQLRAQLQPYTVRADRLHAHAPMFLEFLQAYGLEHEDGGRLERARQTLHDMTAALDVQVCDMCTLNGQAPGLASLTRALPCGCWVCAACVSNLVAQSVHAEHDTSMSYTGVRLRMCVKCPFCNHVFERQVCTNSLDTTALSLPPVINID
jgi:hypothetical protein